MGVFVGMQVGYILKGSQVLSSPSPPVACLICGIPTGCLRLSNSVGLEKKRDKMLETEEHKNYPEPTNPTYENISPEKKTKHLLG